MLFLTWMTLETMQYRNSDFCRDLLPWVIMANSTFNNSFRHIYSYGVSSDRNTGYSDHLCHHVRLKICIYTQRKKSFMEFIIQLLFLVLKVSQSTNRRCQNDENVFYMVKSEVAWLQATPQFFLGQYQLELMAWVTSASLHGCKHKMIGFK